ncbi:glycosyltransferase family 9 protein [Campylobacter sp. CCS1377]|uniref:Glycosyltransferase family 9 protein n=1 Tax=Campylobacter sp. CCS1377 TaxID=3158229 RepID=A0AAU7E9H8_9BACT|nr:lipopolysaccharide heptosyltransferase I [Campylobacter jejuni]
MENSPFIDEIHSLNFKKLLKSPKGIMQIRAYCKNCAKFDVVVDMQGLLKSALIGKFLQSDNFVGFSYKSARESLASLFYTHKVKIAYDENILKRNYAVLYDFFSEKPKFSEIIKAKTLGIDEEKIPTNLKEIKEEKSLKILFVLEASIKQKMYPAEKYAKLVSMIKQKICVYVVFNDYENIADEFLKLLESKKIKALKLPRLNFNELKFTLSNMDLVVGPDTGVTHLAWALNSKTITLYGNSNKSSGKNMRNTKLERVLLGNNYVVSKSDDFEINCIEPNEILEKIRNLLLT